MNLEKIEKKAEGRFITRYDLTYRLKDGQEKVYEIISRDKSLSDLAGLQKAAPDSVVMILTDPTGEKLLLNREFRMAVGDWIYSFPAGLIDPGETPEEAAARELREETGLTLRSITDMLGNSYSAIGFSNELNFCVFGVAEGAFQESTSLEEEIEPCWVTKEQVRALLRTEKFAEWTLTYCYAWALT